MKFELQFTRATIMRIDELSQGVGVGWQNSSSNEKRFLYEKKSAFNVSCTRKNHFVFVASFHFSPAPSCWNLASKQRMLVLRKKHWTHQSSTEKRSTNKWARTYHWPFFTVHTELTHYVLPNGLTAYLYCFRTVFPKKRVAGSVFSSEKNVLYTRKNEKNKKTEKNIKKQKKTEKTETRNRPPLRHSWHTRKKLPRGPVVKESGVVAKKTSGLPCENKHDEKLPNLHENYSDLVG